MFQTPPVPRDRVSGYLGWGGGDYSLVLKRPTCQISVAHCAWPGNLIFDFQLPPSRGIGLSGVARLQRGGGQFIRFGEACIQNLSLLVCLEALEKFVVVGWSRPVLGFSLGSS